MCDTLYLKRGDKCVFGKNSDRGCNEPNLLIFIPRTNNLSKTVRCTYIEIDQVATSNAVMLYKPSWMWGAEMGTNEYGVTIGNEAVFTKSKGKKVERLIGMDMLRLALERSSAANEAIEVLIELLTKYGQGGNCGFDKAFYYDNSFLVCDNDSAYIMETSGDKYCVKKCEKNANISNRLSFDDKFDRSNLTAKIDFAKANSDFIFTTFSGSKARSCKAATILDNSKLATVQNMRMALTSHKDESLSFDTLVSSGSVGSVCMHQSALGDHTTGSMMVEYNDDFNTIWLTGCSTPCLSVYKPYFFGEASQVVFGEQEQSVEYWLKREYLMRGIYAGIINEVEYRQKVNNMQKLFFQQHLQLRDRQASKQEFVKWAKGCCDEEQQLVDSYSEQIQQVKEGVCKLPKAWSKWTRSLGKNVFQPTLIGRQGK